MKMKSLRKTWLAGLIAAGALIQAASAAEMTAFQLIKEGNRYVSDEAKDKVVEIRSEKSVAGLTPVIWFIVYYDPDASLKATEVKFGAGKKLSVKRPLRLLEPVTGDTSPLDRDKMKVDSDKAIQIALKEPLLDKLTIKATELKLVRAGDLFERDNKAPVWRVRLWAAKLRNPNRDADIGEVVIAAEDGKVLKADLHINRVD
jgi:hypothetical protein